MLEDDLFTRVALLLAAVLGLMLVAVSARLRAGRETPASARIASPAGTAREAAAGGGAGSDTPLTPWRDSAIEVLALAVYRRAFGTANFNYTIHGEHEAVIERVRRAIPQAATRREYFPRKPLVIPRLFAALKSSASSVKELVEIIMQDPALTGDALRLANSPFHRASREPVDSINRAVVLLGIDGLRTLIASSVMQPVFQVPRTYFEAFSDTTWRQAQYAALAAQTWAREQRQGDSFAAHLLALVLNMSQVVLFRMAVENYKLASGSLPRAEVFTRLLDECTEPLAAQIAAEWELPPAMSEALEQHAGRLPLEQLEPLARALYFGRICGMAAIAAEDGALDEQELLQLLQRKGMSRSDAEALWRATWQGGAGQA